MTNFSVLPDQDLKALESRLNSYQQKLLDSYDLVDRLTSNLKISVVLNVVVIIALFGLVLNL